MELKMYSFRDEKAGIFYPPIFKGTHGEAERDFANIINHKGSTMNQNPEDYHMYYLGTYDNNTGQMQSIPAPQHMAHAIHLVKKDEPKLASV